MFPTLQQLATAALIRFKHCLSDVGDVPVELLGDVLAACSSEELADIEDGTREGSGRELSPWLWPFWHQLLVARFGALEPAEQLPRLPNAAELARGPPGVRPADYRAVYNRRLAELDRKRAESGARLRALREQAEQQCTARHVLVVDPQPQRRRQAGKAAPPPPTRPGANPHRQLLQPARQGEGSARERLLRKLGMGKASSSRSGAQPARHVIIRPAQRAPAAAAAAGQRSSSLGPQASSPSFSAPHRQQAANQPPAASLQQQPRLARGSSKSDQPGSPAFGPPSGLRSPAGSHGAGRGSSLGPSSRIQLPANGTVAAQQQPAKASPAAAAQVRNQHASPQHSPLVSPALPQSVLPCLEAQCLPVALIRAGTSGSSAGDAALPSSGRPKQQARRQEARAVAVVLEEVDIFAGQLGEQQAMPGWEPARQQKTSPAGQQQRKRPAGGAAHALASPVKKARSEQRVAAPVALPPRRLVEVDLFDGL